MNIQFSIKKLQRFLLGCIAVIFVMAITFEILCAIAIESHLISGETPNYQTPGLKPFWVDENPHFGMWHPANEEYTHTKSCFSALYTSNSFVARDKERSKESKERQVLVIGAPFVEGYGLNSPERKSDFLEQKMGIEHLNFATSGHFVPTQYLLLYQHLSKQFRHDSVIIGLLSDNDLRMMTLNMEKSTLRTNTDLILKSEATGIN
ncbi:MAG: hypothetical protein OSA23_15985 [Rhodospirillales bacterium]|nr:hypothetical protein [Rhodospirillales bacterium]